MIVAIDGPAGSGKSSTARALADRTGLIYLDTGAMYRAVALRFLQLQVDASEENVPLVWEKFSLDLSHSADGMKISLNGVDVSKEIRTPEVTDMSSRVSVLPDVRARMVQEQQRIAASREEEGKGVIVEGRDIGTVVFPSADVKIFLDASPGVRARRRWVDFESGGHEVDQKAIENALVERDERDRTRTISPLKKADDAILIDTTHLSLNEQIEMIESIVRERMDRRAV
ncbi:MAG: (d)CMP kinase [Bacteroidetes bacterium]|nr:(d)CMP kinase [Bacteroidota bacterium]